MSTYTSSFTGCWAKVKRAQEPRDTLETYIDDFFKIKTNCPRINVKFDIGSSENTFFIDYVPDTVDFLNSVSVRLGDIIHNLRCVLGHAVFELARWHTGDNLKYPKSGFPE